MKCPSVHAIDFYPDGTVKRVEFRNRIVNPPDPRDSATTVSALSPSHVGAYLRAMGWIDNGAYGQLHSRWKRYL